MVDEDLDARVSRHINDMPFLWLEVKDDPGPASRRGLIERNATALLIGYHPPSAGWFGHLSDRERVRRSGLWTSNHVDRTYDSSSVEVLESRIVRSNAVLSTVAV